MKTKYFIVATSGATVDGREIKAEHLTEAADSYDPSVYSARIWNEHFRSLYPDGSFPAYGHVLDLKTQKADNDKVQLLAQLDINNKMMEVNKEGQKLFTSVEINPKFSDTKKAYLMGLAITDSPASIGTEMLKFCTQNKDFKSSDKLGDSIYSDSQEITLDFKENKPSLFEKVTQMLTKSENVNSDQFTDMNSAIELIAQKQVEYSESTSQTITKMDQQLQEFNATLKILQDFKTQLEQEDQQNPRLPSTGENTGRIKAQF